MRQILLLTIMLLWGGLGLNAQRRIHQELPLIPTPANLQLTRGSYKLPQRVRIHYTTKDFAFAAEYLHQYLREDLALSPITKANKIPGHITIIKSGRVNSSQGYKLSISEDNGITIRASHTSGALYGVMTLLQLLEGRRPLPGDKLVIPAMEIADTPRYEMRALMLDPARHFLPLPELKRFVDRMVRYKFNTLQLHLSDDQGWRVEIASHPELTQIGARRTSKESLADNGYYTAVELRELVAYAQERGIDIIPEIDIPGHTAALLHAKPELKSDLHRDSTFVLGKTDNVMLSATNPTTYAVLDDILRELAEIFPRGARLHLGGDESAIERNWARSPEHQSFMQAQGIKSERELMGYFFERVLASARKYGFKPILWCELDNIRMPAKEYLFNYPKDVTLVTWRMGLTPKSMELTRASGHQLILAPGESAYFDYPQYKGDLPEFNNWGMPITTLERAYTWDIKSNLYIAGDNNILGVMGTMWAEAMPDMNRVLYMTYPRALALAEVGWSPLSKRSWSSFVNRLLPVLAEMQRSGIPYRVPFEVYAELVGQR